MYTKRIFNLLLLSFITLSSLSCGSGKNKIPKVSPIGLSISGDLADYIQIVDNKYEIADAYANGVIAIKIKGLKPIEEDKLKNKNIELSATLFGKDGEPLSGVAKFTTTDEDSISELRSLLKKGDGEIVISLNSGFSGYNQNSDGERAKQFTLSSSIVDKPKEVPPTSNASTSDNTSEDSSTMPSATSDETAKSNADVMESNDNDQMLDAFEKYMDDYIELMHKMSRDDNPVSMLSGYPQMLTHAIELDRKLKTIHNDLTVEQASRLIELELKMAKAMSEMPLKK